MSKNKKMLLLVAVLAVLLIGYFFLVRHNTQKAEVKENGEKLLTVEPDSVVRLATSQTVLEKKDGVWYWTGDDEFPVDQTKVQTLLESILSIGSKRTVLKDELDQGTETGLDVPKIVVLTMENGEQQTLKLGAENEFSFTCYLQLGDDDTTLYMVDKSYDSTFMTDKDELVLQESLPDFSDATKITVQNEKGTFVWTKNEETDAWQNGEGTDVDTTQVTMFLTQLTDLQWDGFITYRADASELTTYGLTDPTGYVSVTTPDSTTTLDLGAETDGTHYARLHSSQMVYQLGDMASTILAVSGNYFD